MARSNRALMTVEQNIYIPEFDIDTNTYKDECPYKSGGFALMYQCRCKSGASFNTIASYKQHIKSQHHRHWISNYKNYFKEVDEANGRINELLGNLDKKHREIIRIKKEYPILKSEISIFKNENSILKHENSILKNENSFFKKESSILNKTIKIFKKKIKDKKKQIDKLEEQVNILDNQFSEVIN